MLILKKTCTKTKMRGVANEVVNIREEKALGVFD